MPFKWHRCNGIHFPAWCRHQLPSASFSSLLWVFFFLSWAGLTNTNWNEKVRRFTCGVSNGYGVCHFSFFSSFLFFFQKTRQLALCMIYHLFYSGDKLNRPSSPGCKITPLLHLPEVGLKDYWNSLFFLSFSLRPSRAWEQQIGTTPPPPPPSAPQQWFFPGGGTWGENGLISSQINRLILSLSSTPESLWTTGRGTSPGLPLPSASVVCWPHLVPLPPQAYILMTLLRCPDYVHLKVPLLKCPHNTPTHWVSTLDI